MSLPIVAIVGRPNVGKSSLLNSLAGRRISIVDATPGVTRDRVAVPVSLGERGDDAGPWIELVDTGGMGIEDADRLTDRVESQIDFAVRAASVILFVLDAREGIAPLDKHVAERLRRQNKPVVLVANKVDLVNLVAETGEMHALGFGEPVEVSAVHNRGRNDLLDALTAVLPETGDRPPDPLMKLAVVGKRNAGKSTFINALAGEQRVIVSETPGTTRDSVDVTVELEGRRFMLIDTAGVRKKSRLADDVEFYSRHRALRSIRRADVVAMMIDASVPVSQVDKELGGQIAEQLVPVVLVVNKWDLATGQAAGEDYADYLARSFPQFAYAPVSLTVARERGNVVETVELAEDLFDQARTRVPTARLNEAIQEILELRGPSHKVGTRRPKILYASQISTAPPTIVCFVNDPRSFDATYERFLINQLRERLPFAEVPIRLIIRQRRRPGEQS